MSQPQRQSTPSQSPTPSKSSLRRTSGAQNPSQRSLLPPPSPHFEDQPAVPVRYSPRSPPNQTLEYESDEDDEPLFQPDPSGADDEDSYFPYGEPERPFQPFFTLIEDGLTSEHHHPSVHYVFADDDAELVTEAALYSLEQDEPSESSNTDNGQAKESHIDNGAETSTRLPPPSDGVHEHYLILDVHPVTQAQPQTRPQYTSQHTTQPQTQTQSQSQNAPQPDFTPSYAVTSFTSLSPDWQIFSASITAAPTMGDHLSEDEGLMLRIEGRGIPTPNDHELPSAGKIPTGTSDERDTTTRKESLEDMIERFQSRLGEVRQLIETDTGAGLAGIGIGAGGGDGTADAVYHEGQGIGYSLEEQD